MRILSVYDCLYPDRHGGVEHRNYRLAQALVQRGHQVTLAGWSREPVSGPEGVRVVSLPGEQPIYTAEGKRSPAAAAGFARAVALLDVGAFDLIETANIPYAHILPLSVKSMVSGVPLMVTWHEYWGDYWREYLGTGKGRLFQGVEWGGAQLGQRVVAVSQFTGRRVARRRVGARTVPVVPNGAPVERIEQLSTWEGKGEREGLVFAGRFHRNKRLDLLLYALAKLDGRGRRYGLTLIGDGPEEQRLRRLTRRLGLEEQVEFTGRLPDVEDVWRRMATAQIAVQPSAREGFGMFPLEAMAAGLPVVYCEAAESAVGELVRDGREGVEAPANPDGLAREIEGLLDRERRVDELRRAVRRRAEEYSWEAVAERFEEVASGVV